MLPCKDHGQKGNPDGYGHSGKKKLHREVFFEHNGYYPECVMHACDNPRCLEPTHLVAGNHDLNNKDRASKGRSTKVRHDLRKLSDEDALEIKRRLSMRTTRKDKINGPIAIAAEYKIHITTIYQITKGVTHFA